MTSRLCLIALAGLIAACSRSEPDLMTHPTSRTGPDEFAIIPAKPLQEPPDKTLPVPTPGSRNRADAAPLEDVAVALGGSAAAVNRDGIPASDGGLITYTSRLGQDPLIRQTLAREDLEFRQRNDGLLLERWFNVNVYYDTYDRHSLDQQAEIDRFRRAGVPTPSAPPAELKPK